MNDGDIIQVAHIVLNVGGLNIFGEKFGNYPQPIVLKINFEFPGGSAGKAG